MNEEESNVQVESSVPDIIDDLCNEHSAFSFAPAEDFADEAECIGLDAHGHVFALVAADFLHFGVFGPGAYWDLRVLLAIWRRHHT